MLFSGDESLKSVIVLSGGEKVRSMLSKIMMEKPNVLLLDEPTNHLDIESITSLDEGMKKFKGAIVFTTYDQELIESVSNRLIEIKKDGQKAASNTQRVLFRSEQMQTVSVKIPIEQPKKRSPSQPTI